MRFIIVGFILLSGLDQLMAVEPHWSTIQDQVDQSIGNGDAEALQALDNRIALWQSEQPEWQHYWRAYIAFRAILLEPEGESQHHQMMVCKEQAEAAVNNGENSGESHALLASCLGRLAASNTSAAMRYGSEAGTIQDESILIAPDNPRVLMLAAVSDYNKPVMWGGDIDRAERRLRRSISALEMQTPDPSKPWQPTWGHVDAYGHLAIVLGELDQPDGALDVLDQAAALGFQSGWLDSLRSDITNQ